MDVREKVVEYRIGMDETITTSVALANNAITRAVDTAVFATSFDEGRLIPVGIVVDGSAFFQIKRDRWGDNWHCINAGEFRQAFDLTFGKGPLQKNGCRVYLVRQDDKAVPYEDLSNGSIQTLRGDVWSVRGEKIS